MIDRTRRAALAIAPLLALMPIAAVAQSPAVVPSFEDVISLRRVGAPAISPDGRWVAYTVSEANWDENEFETEIWLAEADGASAPRQLTAGKKSSSAPAWAPDGGRLAFLSDREGKRQIYLIDPRGGESMSLTRSKEGVTAFRWAPDARSVAYTENDAKQEPREARDKKYGEFEIVDEDHTQAHLHVVEVTTQSSRRLTGGAFTVGRFAWAPDGTALAFDHRPNPDPGSGGDADISLVTVSDGAIRPLVAQDGPDANPVWSPDGRTIAFETAMADPWFYYANGSIATIPADGGSITVLTKTLDEDPSLLAWGPDGIYVGALDRTGAYLFHLDPVSGRITRRGPADGSASSGFSFSSDFERVAFTKSDASSVAELFVGPRASLAGRKLTDMHAQLANWPIGTRELVRWRSTDGTAIEGVLHKPPGFEAGRRHPLLIVIHGGPTGVSRPTPGGGYVYPIVQWLAKGALVLEPNYRGSAGYGERFRSLNVRNLGVGDAWDVVSGIDHLVDAGLVDAGRVGAMGWSQGGYISAFLTTHDSARFKAVSVGAGISNWVTYYVNTDIHPFTRQYLRATPWDDPEIYAKTSPMTYIKQAGAPTLIQHGENDKRVPIPNAFELYQGLRDVGAKTRLVVYKGFGHGLNKPKAQLAAMQHNFDWFNEHLWEEPSPSTASTGQAGER